jgi:hypothetical protein
MSMNLDFYLPWLIHLIIVSMVLNVGLRLRSTEMDRFAMLVLLACATSVLSMSVDSDKNAVREVSGAGDPCDEVRDTPNCGNAGAKVCTQSFPQYRAKKEGEKNNSLQDSAKEAYCGPVNANCLNANVNYNKNKTCDPN